MSDEQQARAGCGCGGCATTIVGALIIWAFIFGWTWHGVHHTISCGGCDKGVEIKP